MQYFSFCFHLILHCKKVGGPVPPGPPVSTPLVVLYFKGWSIVFEVCVYLSAVYIKNVRLSSFTENFFAQTWDRYMLPIANFKMPFHQNYRRQHASIKIKEELKVDCYAITVFVCRII